MAGPSGTVTFLFADIVGSIGRWEHSGGAMADLLALHDRTLVSAVEAHGRAVVKHTGDGVLAAFTAASDAVVAAVAAQRGLGQAA